MKNFHVVKATSLGWDRQTHSVMKVSLYSPRFKSRKTVVCKQDESTTDAAVRYLLSIGFDIAGTCQTFDVDYDLIICNTFEPLK